MDEKTVTQQFDELQLIKYSLLPSEILQFLDDSNDPTWVRLLDEYGTSMAPSDVISRLGAHHIYPAEFLIKMDGQARLWFEVKMPDLRDGSNRIAAVSIKGDYLSRAEQERWQDVIREKQRDVEGAEYPNYELLSLHLLPLLHEHEHKGDQTAGSGDAGGREPPINAEIGSTVVALVQQYHVLFTSHHLVSPHKRRSLQEWSSSLGLSGFAKVGYPGVIYAQGERDSVKEFAANVKSMQWLALRMRFVEPADGADGAGYGETGGKGTWREFQKVGEVVEEMKRLGRDKYMIDMGIGNLKAR